MEEVLMSRLMRYEWDEWVLGSRCFCGKHTLVGSQIFLVNDEALSMFVVI